MDPAKTCDPTSRARPWYKALSLKITVAVFLSIVAIETAILFPSYLNHQQDLLDQVERTGRAHAVSGFRTAAGDAPPVALIALGNRMVAAGDFKGGALFDQSGQRLGAFGDAPAFMAVPKATAAVLQRADPDGRHLDVYWPATVMNLPHGVAARLDTEWIAAALNSFVLRIFGLVLIISGFVCAVTMFIVHRLVLNRVLALDRWLASIDLDSDQDRPAAPKTGHDDELADTAAALYAMVDRAFASFQVINRMGNELADANAQLSQRVETSTRDLITVAGERQQAEAEYRDIFENAVQGIIRTTPAGQFARLNAAFAEMMGYASPDDMIANVTDITNQLWVNGDERDQMLDRLNRDGRTTAEVQMRRKDGAITWVSMSVWKGEDQGTGATYVEGILEDITERRHAEARVKQLNEELERLVEERTQELHLALDNMTGGIFMIDRDFTVRMASPSYAATFELPAELVRVGESAAKIIKFRAERGDYGPGDSKVLIERRLELYRRQQATTIEDTLPGGKIVEVHFSPLENGGFVNVFNDITARRNTERQLVQADKLATLGTLAAGTAHELAQPLNIIRLTTDSILYDLNEADAAVTVETEDLRTVVAQVLRMAEIIDHMRIFSRKEDVAAEPFMPTEVITNVLNLIEKQFASIDIALESTVPENSALVSGSAGQLEQVILNLIANARDAVEASRTSDAAAVMSPGKINVALTEDNALNQVVITVADNGGGIDEDVLKNIFDPFFTTKEVGEGTGLGLSVSYSIITAMGGTITARNSGEGVHFSINLPRLDAVASIAP